MRLGLSRSGGVATKYCALDGKLPQLLGRRPAVLEIDVFETPRFAIREQRPMQGLVAATHPKGEDRFWLLARVKNVGVRGEGQPNEFRPGKSTLKLLRCLAIGDETWIEAIKKFAAMPIFVTEGSNASRTKLDRRARTFMYEARWIAPAGREVSCTQKRTSRSFISDRTSAHCFLCSQATGGGEMIRTPGWRASPEKSGGRSVVQ